MQAMILAAGRGSRMESLTENCPKPLLKLGNLTLIEHRINALVLAGITDVVINVCYLGEAIIRHLSNGDHLGVNIQYSVEEHPLETAGGIINALHVLKNEPFWVINADIVTDFDFSQVIDLQQSLAHLILVDNPTYNECGDFDYACDTGSKRLTYSGIGYYHPDLFREKKIQKQELRTVINQGLMNNVINTQHYQGYWQDVGTPGRLKEAEAYLKANQEKL